MIPDPPASDNDPPTFSGRRTAPKITQPSQIQQPGHILKKWFRLVPSGQGHPIPKDIPGTDNRLPVSDLLNRPACAVCALISYWQNGRTGGTGTLIGQKTIVTAGHNLFDRDTGETPSQITVMPGRGIQQIGNGFQVVDPFGVQMVGPGQYTAHQIYQDTGNEDYDYGVIFLRSPASGDGGTANPLDCWAATDRDVLNQPVYTLGYNADNAKDLPPSPAGDIVRRDLPSPWPDLPEMWGNAGRIYDPTPTRLIHSADTVPGASGSALLLWVDQRFWIVGIHTEGLVTANGAVRVNDRLIGEFTSWLQQNGDL